MRVNFYSIVSVSQNGMISPKDQFRSAMSQWDSAYLLAVGSQSLASTLPQWSAVILLLRTEEVYSQVLQDVLRRVKKPFKAFFRHVDAGEKPGYRWRV